MALVTQMSWGNLLLNTKDSKQNVFFQKPRHAPLTFFLQIWINVTNWTSSWHFYSCNHFDVHRMTHIHTFSDKHTRIPIFQQCTKVYLSCAIVYNLPEVTCLYHCPCPFAHTYSWIPSLLPLAPLQPTVLLHGQRLNWKILRTLTLLLVYSDHALVVEIESPLFKRGIVS